MTILPTVPLPVVIIGGGLSGLAAAYELEKRGIKTALFEASNRLGGRVHTVKLSGLWEEGGGKGILDGGEGTEIKRICAELNIPLGAHPWPSATTVLSHNKLISFYDIADALESSLEAFKNDLISSSLGEALDKHLKDHPEARRMMEMRVLFYEGAPSHDLSFHYHKSTYIWMAEAAISGQPRLQEGQKDEEEYQSLHFSNGSQEMVGKMATKISSVFMDHELVTLSQEQGFYKLTFASGLVIYASTVVLAIPLLMLKKISEKSAVFPESFGEVFQKMGMGKCAKILIPLKIPYEAGKVGLGSDMAAFFNERKNVLVLFLAGDSTCWKAESLTERQALKDKYLKEVMTFFPDVQLEEDVEKWAFCNWVNEPFVHGSYSYFKDSDDGSVHKLIPYKDQLFKEVFAPIDESLFICGEHTTLEYIGTMEGAVESGVRVAKVIKG